MRLLSLLPRPLRRLLRRFVPALNGPWTVVRIVGTSDSDRPFCWRLLDSGTKSVFYIAHQGPFGPHEWQVGRRAFRSIDDIAIELQSEPPDRPLKARFEMTAFCEGAAGSASADLEVELTRDALGLVSSYRRLCYHLPQEGI